MCWTHHEGSGNGLDNILVVGDSDSDGVSDDVDNCPGDANTDQADGDGVCASADNCPTPNAGQEDGDGDSVGDACDSCPATPNADQADGDSDGAGDTCDPCPTDNPDDADGDGVCASADACPDTPAGAIVHPDGCPLNAHEICAMTLDLVQQSDAYQELGWFSQKILSLVVKVACKVLLKIGPHVAPAHAASFIAAYQTGVDHLVGANYLTPDQGAALKATAGALL